MSVRAGFRWRPLEEACGVRELNSAEVAEAVRAAAQRVAEIASAQATA
ncbi:hypothetical protein [Amycolatopsis nalaikhensis]|uniref:Uncharacterized protein n=1 Tax=Amycolatopsis nalaikhensis TaxID=715472 RepID=A0ABY8XTZ5_9PSEU|nr:hypothetical protein [Amycolatopsis sp. 2-2]WIV59123.1 hypothetical protein QP939_11075 [Amycolatopsis sp. 2-2]